MGSPLAPSATTKGRPCNRSSWTCSKLVSCSLGAGPPAKSDFFVALAIATRGNTAGVLRWVGWGVGGVGCGGVRWEVGGWGLVVGTETGRAGKGKQSA